MKRLLLIGLTLLALAACAPDDLDITPTTTPTATPEPTATRPPTATPDPNQTEAEQTAAAEAADAAAEAEAAAAAGTLDTILAAFPQRWTAGAAQWIRTENDATGEDIALDDREGGRSFTIYYSEAGGSYAEITIGEFESPEAALAFFDFIAENTRVLERAEARENFPEPNLFGGGTYGQDAITVQDNLFIRVSVPRFSSGLGNDALGPMMRAALRVIEGALGG